MLRLRNDYPIGDRKLTNRLTGIDHAPRFSCQCELCLHCRRSVMSKKETPYRDRTQDGSTAGQIAPSPAARHCRAIARDASPKAPIREPIGGQTMVEFALIIPVFLLLMLGVVQMIVVSGAALAVNQAAISCARYTSLNPSAAQSSVGTYLTANASPLISDSGLQPGGAFTHHGAARDGQRGNRNSQLQASDQAVPGHDLLRGYLSKPTVGQGDHDQRLG
jgi:hypothetical protein